MILFTAILSSCYFSREKYRNLAAGGLDVWRVLGLRERYYEIREIMMSIRDVFDFGI